MDVSFWVTSDCNLSCKYCYEGKEKKQIYMSRDIVDKSIEYTFKYLKNINKNDFRVQIHGGEPFLAFDTIKYLVYRVKDECNRRNINVSFLTTTNGTIMNDDIIEFIKKEMPSISISLDGTKETHDNIRLYKSGKGSHSTTLKNSLKLLNNSVYVRIRNTFDSESVGNLSKDIKYLIDKGFKCISSAPNVFDENWSEESIKRLEKQVKKIKSYVKEEDKILINLIDKNLYKTKGACEGGKTSINIYPDGSIYPCTIVTGNKEFCIGNIYDGVDEKKVDDLLYYSNKINKDCDGCKINKYCKGSRCKIINKVITNDYCKPSATQCAIERLNYRLNIEEFKNK